MASLSVEPSGPEDSIIVALFETPYTKEAVAAWLEREYEYRFLAVRTEGLDGTPSPRLAVRSYLMPLNSNYCSRQPPGQLFCMLLQH